jgi:hypothetical protein
VLLIVVSVPDMSRMAVAAPISPNNCTRKSPVLVSTGSDAPTSMKTP